MRLVRLPSTTTHSESVWHILNGDGDPHSHAIAISTGRCGRRIRTTYPTAIGRPLFSASPRHRMRDIPQRLRSLRPLADIRSVSTRQRSHDCRSGSTRVAMNPLSSGGERACDYPSPLQFIVSNLLNIRHEAQDQEYSVKYKIDVSYINDTSRLIQSPFGEQPHLVRRLRPSYPASCLRHVTVSP